MIDGIEGISQLGSAFFRNPENSVQSSAQSESANLVDITRFQGAMSGVDEGVQSLNSNNMLVLGDSQSLVSVNQSGVIDSVLSGVSQMDGGYRDITARVAEWPSFSSYLDQRGVSGVGVIGEDSGHISNIDDILMQKLPDTAVDPQERVTEAFNRIEHEQHMQKEFYAAGIEYQKDSAMWFLGAEFWLTKVKVLTSAVSQVSNGLKTLFMSR